MKRSYSLPNGKNTTSERVYIREWRKLGRVAEKVFPGYKATAFDPGIQLTNHEGYWDSINLSVRALAALQKSQSKT